MMSGKDGRGGWMYLWKKKAGKRMTKSKKANGLFLLMTVGIICFNLFGRTVTAELSSLCPSFPFNKGSKRHAFWAGECASFQDFYFVDWRAHFLTIPQIWTCESTQRAYYMLLPLLAIAIFPWTLCTTYDIINHYHRESNPIGLSRRRRCFARW